MRGLESHVASLPKNPRFSASNIFGGCLIALLHGETTVSPTLFVTGPGFNHKSSLRSARAAYFLFASLTSEISARSSWNRIKQKTISVLSQPRVAYGDILRPFESGRKPSSWLSPLHKNTKTHHMWCVFVFLLRGLDSNQGLEVMSLSRYLSSTPLYCLTV